MKTVVLHIGTGKTGTSTIQNALFYSGAILRKAAVEYPPVTRIRIDHFGEEIVAHYRLVEILVEENREELQKLHDYITESFADTLIFSCENLYHHLEEPQIRLLQETLEGFDVKVICYVRRQDLYVESAYKQQVKAGYARISFEHFIKRHQNKNLLGQVHANYYRMLKLWSDIFGYESMIVRRFDPACFHNGSLLDDFMQAIDLSAVDLRSATENNTNTALPAQLIQLVRAFNATGIVPQEHQQAFVSYLRSNYEFDDYPLIDKNIIEGMVFNYGDVNNQLAEYFALGDDWSMKGLREDAYTAPTKSQKKSDFELLADFVYSQWTQESRKKPGRSLLRRVYYLGSDILLVLGIVAGTHTVDPLLRRRDYLRFYTALILGAEFSPTFYLRSNLDLRRKKLDPFVHYICFGCKEGRVPHPAMSAHDARGVATRIEDRTWAHCQERDRLVKVLELSTTTQ